MTPDCESRLYRGMGARIRSARLKAKVNQDTLAAHVNLTRTSVSNIEAGRQRIPLHVIYDIAKLLDVDAMSLLPTMDEVSALRRPARGLHGVPEDKRALLEPFFRRDVVSDAGSPP